MLCPLSGLSPLGGPTRLIDYEDLDTVPAAMASEILSYQEVSMSLQDLASIVSSALELTLPPPEYRDVAYNLAPKLPKGISAWEYFRAIGIGHFDEDGYCPVEAGRCPSGRDVQIRLLDDYGYYGRFYNVIIYDEGGSREQSVRLRSYCRSARTDTNCNFFVMRGCLEYLRVWLDPSLPQRLASAPSISFEGELYEIINSCHEIRDDSGLFPSFEYGDIPKTLEQDQFRYLKARKGSHHTSRAINAGLRGKGLLPALCADFQCWLSMRPDIWPSPTTSSTATPTFTRYPTPRSSDPFSILPTELLSAILQHLPIRALLSVSSASRGLRALITEPAFLNHTIKAAVLAGPEYWVLPVKTIPGEEERALRVASEWLTPAPPVSDFDVLPTNTTELPFHVPSFPYLAFMHACYGSDSMRNRQRLWGIAKKFDGMWRDYRLHGCQRDVFITP